jgi:glycosyltransferase involved in cell wall biosynthesis
MNIVFIERIFPHYRKAVYDLVHRQKKFVFLHGTDEKPGIKQIQTEYSSIIRSFHYGRRESQVFLFVFRKLLRERPLVIIHEFSAGILSKPLLLLFCKLFGVKMIFWGHMYDRSKGFHPQNHLSDKYRLWLWRKADSLITYSKTEKELLIKYKIPEEKIFVAFNTIDTTSYLKIRDELEKKGKNDLKKSLGFTHQFNLTFISRLYEEKKPELLLHVLMALKQKGFGSVGIHYVGDGKMLPVLKKTVLELGLEKDVIFHGAVYDEIKTGEILFCSDLMIIPGFVGLAVNHAFCFNCPVATFKQIGLNPPHSPEVEYIIDKKTGFLVEPHSIEALVDRVTLYLESPGLRNEMQTEIRNLIENVCSVEKMTEGVIDAINYNTKKGASKKNCFG